MLSRIHFFLLLTALLFSFTFISSAHSRGIKGYFDKDPIPDKTAYLTFDDGPNEWTEEILDILKAENVKATFFICAYWNNKSSPGKDSFRKYREVLIRMIDEGHIIANHTFEHRALTGLSAEAAKRQFSRNQELLNQALGEKSPVMTIIRPPLGYPWHKSVPLNEQKRLSAILAQTGIVAMWTKDFDTTDSWDWARGEWYRKSSMVNESAPEFKEKMKRIYSRTVERADSAGMVILMHDTHNTTLRILPDLIKGLKAKGYTFATMEDYIVWRYGRSSSELMKGVK